MTLESYLRTAGPPLAPAEIKAALRGQLNSPPVKAVLELLVTHITETRAEALDLPGTFKSPEARHYHAGLTTGLAEFFEGLGQYIES